jgi:RsiW-degrading membrane proteinase PrsW (M82 family)
MLEYMMSFFTSWFIYPNLKWTSLLIGIGLAFGFAAIWFATYWTPILKKPWAWGVLIASAFLSLVVVSFIQIPLQYWTGQVLNHFWSPDVLMRWLLLAGIPQILFSGLVQEGSKLVPVVVYWWRNGKTIDPRLGLVIGAAAGLGFGVFEAVWAHSTNFAAGWTWQAVEAGGFMGLVGFWERFSAVAFHIAASALAGYGLARGWGWQFYLLSSFLHALLNYSIVLLISNLITAFQMEIYATVVAALLTAGVLWLRWRKSEYVVEGIT